jgi:methionine-S-sulfoxide reductase
MNKKIILAGGCFWCVEHDLRGLLGVLDVTSGYSGGQEPNPNYYSHKDHREAVEVTYDTDKISFKKVIQFFLDHIDPTDMGGQFYDRGLVYQTAIFYATEAEKLVSQALLKELNESHIYDKPATVEVLPFTMFYKAEEEHQNYAEKNPVHYAMYRRGSGREVQVNRTCAIREEKHIIWKD